MAKQTNAQACETSNNMVGQIKKRQKIYIDNNVWDLLFKYNIKITDVLPNEDFELFITREAEFEINEMPSELRLYTQEQINHGTVETDHIFGFYNENHPNDEQRVAGFGDKFDNSVKGGRFISFEESQFLRSESTLLNEDKKQTGLYKHEADLALASRARLSKDVVILSCDRKGVLKRTLSSTGQVVDLTKWAPSMALAVFIENALQCNMQDGVN